MATVEESFAVKIAVPRVSGPRAARCRLRRSASAVLPGDVLTSARAYCGAAHGRIWPLDPALTTPDDVVLRYGGSDFPYRLVHDLRLGRPARDGEGRLLYLPSYQDVLAISALLVQLSL